MTLLGLMEAVRDRAAAALDPAPEATVIQPGLEVAWDSSCGLLWVRLSEAVPYYTTGRTSGSPVSRCPVGIDYMLGVGVNRCVASLDNAGRPPTAQQISDNGAQAARDVEALYDALRDWTPPEMGTSRLGQWLPLGPEGGVAGGEWMLHVRRVF